MDIKHTNRDKYKELTGMNNDESLKFREALNKSGKEVWIRQVIVPGLMDSEEYLKSLVKEVKSIKNVKKIDFLPYHNMAIDKYQKLGIEYPYKDIPAMDKIKCNELYNKFMKIYNEEI